MINKNIFITGNTDLIILSILNSNDSYVYEIVKEISRLSNNLLTLSNNTIYTTTYKLQKNGYISDYTKQVGPRRTRVYYHLEEKGKLYLEQLLTAYITTTLGTNHILRNLHLFDDQVEPDI